MASSPGPTPDSPPCPTGALSDENDGSSPLWLTQPPPKRPRRSTHSGGTAGARSQGGRGVPTFAPEPSPTPPTFAPEPFTPPTQVDSPLSPRTPVLWSGQTKNRTGPRPPAITVPWEAEKLELLAVEVNPLVENIATYSSSY